MQRVLSVAVAISGALYLVAAANADDRSQRGRHNDNHHQHSSRNPSRGGWGSVSDIVSHFKHGHDHHHHHNHHNHHSHHNHHNKPTKPTTKPFPIPIDPGRGDGQTTSNPVSNGGFVFVNGHWERERAPTNNKPTPTPVIRDHRQTTGYPEGTIIRDHRTSSNSSGGVKVTVAKGGSTGGSGPTIRDHRTQPIIRDHRTK